MDSTSLHEGNPQENVAQFQALRGTFKNTDQKNRVRKQIEKEKLRLYK